MPVIVTLLSDFGSESPYPAQMKAVLASSCDAVLIDITHDIPRHDIRAGAYVLSAVARTTPAGTVHLAVVDPGVGTTRPPLIVASARHGRPHLWERGAWRHRRRPRKRRAARNRRAGRQRGRTFGYESGSEGEDRSGANNCSPIGVDEEGAKQRT